MFSSVPYLKALKIEEDQDKKLHVIVEAFPRNLRVLAICAGTAVIRQKYGGVLPMELNDEDKQQFMAAAQQRLDDYVRAFNTPVERPPHMTDVPPSDSGKQAEGIRGETIAELKRVLGL